MGKIFLNYNHLGDWLEKAEVIRTTQGTTHALSYLIGEKFFNLASLCRAFRDEYAVNAMGEHLLVCDAASTCSRQFGQQVSPHYKDATALKEIEDMLAEFAALINQSFEPYLVRGYFADALPPDTTASVCSHHLTDRHDAASEPSAIWEIMIQYLGVG